MAIAKLSVSVANPFAVRPLVKISDAPCFMAENTIELTGHLNQNDVGHSNDNPKICAVTDELAHLSSDVGDYEVVVVGIGSALFAITGKLPESRLIQTNNPPNIFVQVL